jgi:cytoskeletal protein CcmA (bactofilin family)
MALWNKSANETTPIPAVPAVPREQASLSPAARTRDPVAPSNTQHEEPYSMAIKSEETSKQAGPSDLLLGAGAEFEGKLTFKGTVRIDAKFKGSIVTNDVLVVGENARIDAEITCGTVVVEGEVNGNVKAKSAVELHRSARLRGNVETASLVVEKGAFLQGEMKMASAEKEASAKPAPSPAIALQ